LYTEEWDKEGYLPVTVEENELLYSTKQVGGAKEAHELLRSSGYPLHVEALNLLTQGYSCSIQLLMKDDLERT
jgi:hypothetical protein